VKKGHKHERVREVVEAVMRMVTIEKAVKGDDAGNGYANADIEEEMMSD
jgi:hypothetical protein